jgi:uncharacterized protein YigA (DUF484 family)
MSDQTVIDTESPTTEDQVAKYLRKHPDFFVKQPGLLADLRLPHESGGAISLVERQVSILRERNMDMRHRLSKLLDNARDNDRLFDKTKRLVLALLEGKTLADTVDSLYYSFEHEFEIHYTTLILFGDAAVLPSSKARVESLSQAREHIAQVLKSSRPLCGVLTDKEVRYLFPDHANNVGSIALVPLMHGNTFGVLAIANRDSNHYRSSMGTLFLSYIGEVLNRQLPRHLPR